MRRAMSWALGLAFAAWILVPASIATMHAFGAWWGGLIVPLTLACVLLFWRSIDR